MAVRLDQIPDAPQESIRLDQIPETPVGPIRLDQIPEDVPLPLPEVAPARKRGLSETLSGIMAALPSVGPIRDVVGAASLVAPTPGTDPDARGIGFVESAKEEFQRPARGAQMVPGLGGVVGAAENLAYLAASDRLAHDYDYSKPVSKERLAVGARGHVPARYASKEKDIELISNLLIQTEKQQERGYTLGGKVAKGLLQLPTWMAEFAMTGGLAKLGNAAAQKAGTKLIQRYAKTKAGKAALKTAGWAGGAITRATLGLTPRVVEKATERQVEIQILGADQEGWATSFAKAWGDVTIEAASEEAGKAITGIPIKLLNKTKLGGKFVKGLQTAWIKATGGSVGGFARKLAEKGGYSNIIGEIGEERLGTFLRAMTKVDDFGAGKDAGPVDRLIAGLKQDAQNFGVEAIVLSVPMTAQVALGGAAGAARKLTEPRTTPATGALGTAESLLGLRKPARTAEQISLNQVSTAGNIMARLMQQGMTKEQRAEIMESGVSATLSEPEIQAKMVEAGQTIAVAAHNILVNRASREQKKLEPVEELIKTGNMSDTLRVIEENMEPDDTLHSIASWLTAQDRGVDTSTAIIAAYLAEQGLNPESAEGKNAADALIKEAQTKVAAVEAAVEADENDPLLLKQRDKLDEPEYGEPGLDALITNKRILMRRIGIDRGKVGEVMRTYESLLNAKKALIVPVNKIIRALRKQATRGDRIASKIMKRQTKPVDRMVDLLDAYEYLPEKVAKDLSPVEVEAFEKLRFITKWLLDRTNKIRVARGEKPIKDLKAYIPHWHKKTAESLMDGTYLYKSGYLAELALKVPKGFANPTAKKRTLKDLTLKVQRHMERDLGNLMRGLIAYDVHDMMLKEPYDQAKAEVAQLLADEKISERAHKHIVDYLNYDILKRQVPVDKAFNAAPTVKSVTELINKVLRPLNREIHNPAASFYGGFRKTMHRAFLPFRARPATRNLGQRLLLLSFYRGRDFLQAQLGRQATVAHPKFGHQVKLLDLIREQDWYKLTKPEDIMDDKTLLDRLTSAGMIGFRTAHVGRHYVSNVETSALTGYNDWKYRLEQSHDKNSKHYKNIVKESKKTGIPVEQLQTQPEDLMNDIRDAVTFTQWEYMSHAMPVILRGQTNRAIGAYQSWWMNYYTSFLSEGWHRLIYNRTRVRGDGTGGRLLTPGARFRVIKGMGGIYGMAKLVKSATKIAMLSALLMPDPTNGLPPLLNLGVVIGRLVWSWDEPEQRKQAWKDLRKTFKQLLPFGNAVRDAAKVQGDWTLKDYIFYTENAEWKQIWTKIEGPMTDQEKYAAKIRRDREGGGKTAQQKLVEKIQRQREGR